MASSESQLKTALVKSCRSMGAYARRIEDQYAVGILDIIVAFDDLPVMFIEGKRVSGQWMSPTDRQFVEGQRIWQLKGGHIVAVLVGWNTADRMLCSPWASSVLTKDCFKQKDGWDYGQTLQEFAREQY